MQKVIAMSAIAIRSAQPTTRLGALAYMNLSNVARMMARPSLAGIPSNAIISSATVRIVERTAWAATKAMSVSRPTAAWSTSTTWSTRPSVDATSTVTLSKVAAAAGTAWDFDVTAIVQAWISGAQPLNGLVVHTTETVNVTIHGSTAKTPSLVPTLTVNYLVPADPPEGLHPSEGNVSIAKPTLTFTVPQDTSSIQVQIDPAANPTTPAFDSAEVVTAAGLLDLSTTSYAGLASGATTQWRARVKNPLGWSAWSSWATFSRLVKSTLTITQPTATTDDPSPVTTWTFGGTQRAWRVLLLDASGVTKHDSGWIAGTATSTTPTGIVATPTGSVVVQVEDNQVRVATPGDPTYTEAIKAVTFAASGVPTVMTTLGASTDGIRPRVTLTGTRANIPDEVAIYRNGALIARVPGTDVFVGTAFTYLDASAPMNVPATYSVRPIVNGQFANAGPTTTITPSCSGIWLTDVEDNSTVVLWGVEQGEQTQPELAVLHSPITSPTGAVEVIRRRLVRYPRQGTITGTLADVLGITAASTEATLRAWADNDAGRLYRLVLGNLNELVILGDLNFVEVPGNRLGERILTVSASWWARSS